MAIGLRASSRGTNVPATAHVFIAAILGWAATLCGLGLGSAQAATPPTFEATARTEYAQARFIAEADALVPGETLWIALELDLEKGWHVYWRNPGDSGLPLSLSWTLPDGVRAGEPLYPAPEVIPVGPLANFGHHGAPVFLIPLQVTEDFAPSASAPALIGADIGWLVCEEICVPEDARFSLALPTGEVAAPRRETTTLFSKARAAMPGSEIIAASFAGLEEKKLRLGVSNAAIVEVAQGAASVFFFPFDEGRVEPAAPQPLGVEDGRLVLELEGGYFHKPEATSLDGVLVVEQGEARTGFQIRAVRAETVDAVGPTPANLESGTGAGATGDRRAQTSGGTLGGFFGAFFAALAGGAILNLMPCVFPVVFIKAAHITRCAHASDCGREVRGAALVYVAGVLVAFVALAALLISLRSGGAALGWGFQFQSPAVVALLAYLLLLVALNLAGVFEIGESLQGAGSNLAALQGPAGSFFTGVLAVAVAAPCIGPFMGLAVAYALMQPPAIALLIFAAMGLGLASPYLLLAAFPRLGALLPRPGAWMVRFKQFLSFPVFAAVAWLIWVLSFQIGPQEFAMALAGLIFIGFAAWLFEAGKSAAKDSPWPIALRVSAALFLLAALAPALRLTATAEARAASSEASHVYSAETLESLRAERRPVFVEFTAAWCVTCQVNKQTVLSRPSIRAALDAGDIAYVIGDWTMRDAEITRALEAQGRNGVPLYLFYAPGAAEPKILPQVLTEGLVLAAFAES